MGGGTLHEKDLLRFVKGPDGRVWFDPSGKAPGNGVYLHPKRSFFEEALERGALQERLEGALDGALDEQVTHGLANRWLQGLSLARKSGQVAIGLDKVLEARKSRNLSAVILAQDATQRMREKVESLKKSGVEVFELGQKESLSRALGYADTTVIGLLLGQSTLNVLRDVRKYRAFQGVTLGE